MKKFSLILLLAISNFCFGQNWELFKANETYNFNFDNIHGVRVDSVFNNAGETTYLFNRILNDTVHQNVFTLSYPIADITQPNIFGKQCVERNDSLIFTNQFNNLLFIRPKANLNESWRFLSEINYHIDATVDSVYSDSITNALDSLKRITFQYFDSSNTAINHPVNNKVFIISKSNGIVSTFNFYEDVIGNSLNFNYKKQYNQIFKSTTFTNAQVFDLNIGDEYHFSYVNDTPGSNTSRTDLRNHLVTGRTVSSNGDTIRLTIVENRELLTLTIDYTTNPPTVVSSTSFSNRTILRTIYHPNDTFVQVLGFAPTTVSDSLFGVPTLIAKITKLSNTLPYHNGNFGQRLTIHPESEIFVYDSLQSSWIIDYNAYSQYTEYFLTGVFDYTNNWINNGGGGYPEYYRILYFKIGNETWGTPRLVTGIEDQVINEERIYLYPNPANELIQIETSGTSFKEIRVFDMRGRMIQVLPFQNNLNVSEFENGLYLLKLIGQDKVVDLKFVKR